MSTIAAVVVAKVLPAIVIAIAPFIVVVAYQRTHIRKVDQVFSSIVVPSWPSNAAQRCL